MAKMQGHITLIGDNFNTDAVTTAILRSPTWIKNKTDILGNGRPFGHCEWGVETEMVVSDDISVVTDSLLKVFKCSLRTLRQIACDCNAKWNILLLINVYDNFPVVFFSTNFIKFAAEIDAEIGFDVYMLND